MKRFQAKRDAAALNSRLVRRPIQRMVWLVSAAHLCRLLHRVHLPVPEGRVPVLLQIQADQQVDMGRL